MNQPWFGDDKILMNFGYILKKDRSCFIMGVKTLLIQPRSGGIGGLCCLFGIKTCLLWIQPRSGGIGGTCFLFGIKDVSSEFSRDLEVCIWSYLGIWTPGNTSSIFCLWMISCNINLAWSSWFSYQCLSSFPKPFQIYFEIENTFASWIPWSILAAVKKGKILKS